LSDGTKMTLEPGTTLRVAFTNAVRAIRLIEGKVTFAVAEDPKRPQRPFIVHTHVGRVLAMSKKFSVGVDTAGMDVHVQEGEVDILRRNNQPGSEIKIEGGQRHRFPVGGLSAVAANGADRLAVASPPAG
jgi:transmembrane sensor